MSKILITLIGNIPGPARRYCHLHLKTFNPNSEENFFLHDFKKISEKKASKLKSNSTRLYEKILDILFNYYAPKVDTLNTETRLLKRALVLNKLGMQHYASTLSETVINSTIEDHNYLKCLEAFDLRLQFAFEQEDMSYLHHYMLEYREQKEQMIRDYMDLSNYQTLWMIVKQGAMKHHFFSPEEKLEGNYYAQLLDRDEMELTAESKIILFKIKGYISMKEKKPEKALEFMLKTKTVYDNNPWLTIKDPLEYARYIKNTCITLSFLKQTDKAKAMIDSFETEMGFDEKKFDPIQLEIKCIILGIQVDLALACRDFEMYNEKFITEEKFILVHHEKIPPESRISLLYAFFLINLHNRNYRKCRVIINYLSKIDENIRKDLRELTYIGELALHYLEGNIDLLESRLKHLERKLMHESPFFKFTSDVLIYFILKLKDPHAKHSERYLKDILKEAKEGEMSVYFNYNPLLELKR